MRIDSTISQSTATPMQAKTPAPNATLSKGEKGPKELRKACRDFEAIFTSFVLKSMRKTVMKNDLFGSAKQEEYFQDMLDERVSEAAATQTSSGLADVLYRQLSKGLGISAGSTAEGKSGEPTTGGDLR